MRIAAGERQRAAREQRAEERLDDEPAPEAFEHHGDVEARAAEAAVGFGKQRADRAEFGEALPHRAVEAFGRLRDAVAHRERVLFGDEAVQRVRQHPAVFCVLEIHRRVPRYSPSIIFAMMFFWISFEPPKIDSLRLLKYCCAALAASSGPTGSPS